MFFRLVYQSFHRQKRSKLLAGIAVMLGVAVATAVLAVATGVGDRLNRELRALGPNLAVYPAQQGMEVREGSVAIAPALSRAYLDERDLPRIKGIFWRHNILDFAPFFATSTSIQTSAGSFPVQLLGTYFAKPMKYGDEQFTAGVRGTYPTWKVQGTWPRDDAGNEVLAGAALATRLALRPGDKVTIGGRNARITGILSAGEAREQQIIAPLALAQQIANQPNAVASVMVSALTKPEDAFARQNPASMSPAVRDRWYCSPYANSIAFQLAEALPNSRAGQVRRVEQAQGQVLSRIAAILLLIMLAALGAAVLAVSASTAAALLERRHEIGLMRALGAGAGSVSGLFFAEGAVLALIAALLGFGLGELLARQIGLSIFGAAMNARLLLFPLVLVIAVVVMMSGSWLALWRARRLAPALTLREGR